MGLEGIVNSIKTVSKKVYDYFSPPQKIDEMVEYAIRNYMLEETKKRLFQGKNEKERETLYQNLRSYIQREVNYQQDNLNTLSIKAAKGSGIAALVNDAYHMYAGTPLSDFGLLQATLVGAKAILELPAMYKHLTQTGDVYGMLEWLGSKALAWLVPIFGPGLDYNVATRIVHKNAIRQGTKNFLKGLDLYTEGHSLPEQIYGRVKQVAVDRLKNPKYLPPEYQPALNPV